MHENEKVSAMIKVGLISDTHSYLDPQVLDYFVDCDEIWHAGDFGTLEIADQLSEVAPLIGVYGNIDGQDIRQEYPLHQRFKRQGITFWMTHIGGTLGRYCIPIREGNRKRSAGCVYVWPFPYPENWTRSGKE
ncbi:MAG: metallophosphoesterase family protein [Fodinibius sp.]|nr:metallophosphoesterase family protein [Fodinibius sp.]